jgi:hypothetical protein
MGGWEIDACRQRFPLILTFAWAKDFVTLETLEVISGDDRVVSSKDGISKGYSRVVLTIADNSLHILFEEYIV